METRITHPHSWDFRRKKIAERVKEDGVENFFTWPTVVGSMYTGGSPEASRALGILKSQSNWDDLLPHLTEHKNAPPLSILPRSSGTMILQAFHLHIYREMTGKSLESHERIVEFGGGYGALALLLHRLGFSGDYEIVDLPEIAALQEYYLEDVPVTLSESVTIEKPDILIGFNSLSEAPYRDRARALSSKPKEIFALFMDIYRSNDTHNKFDNRFFFESLWTRGYGTQFLKSPINESHTYVIGRLYEG